MVSKKNKTSRVELPNELIENILSRLPLKYLLRFRCVCKSWNFLIAHDSGFHNLHLRNSNLNGNKDGSIWFSYESAPYMYYRVYGYNFRTCHESFPYITQIQSNNISIKLDQQLFMDFTRSQVVGLCDGVLAGLHWK
ncbi:hypothetical protein RND81_02G214900 [Saponaria officinalis]|uniref:F-box domain-containing protein n=1 Tax=Saponaria officinalis TaxID=3572 RepID=A0AAW1MS92_SAPOF